MLPLFYQGLAANSLLLKLLSHLYLIFRASDENKHGWGKTHPKKCAPYQTHMATQCPDIILEAKNRVLPVPINSHTR